MSFIPEVKNPGDLAKSEEWNEAMDEIVRLENDKVDNTGDTITGRLTITAGGDVAPGSGGFLVLGNANGLNIAMDNNEIMARNNDQTATLHLQADGDEIRIHNNCSNSQKVIITNSGQVGIGTTSPGAKLHVSGDFMLGENGTLMQRMVAGRVSSAGDKLAGSGFTSSKLSTGKYRLNFSPPFSALPVVVANCSDMNDDNIISATPQSNSQVHIAVFDMDPNVNANPEDASFSFIAIGLA